MKKLLFSLSFAFLVILFTMQVMAGGALPPEPPPSNPPAQSEPTITLTPPTNLTITNENDTDFLLSWNIDSTMQAFYSQNNNKVAIVQIDYKIDNGEWKYTTAWDLSLKSNLPEPLKAYDASGIFADTTGLMNFTWNPNETNTIAIDVNNHAYYYRVRLAYQSANGTLSFSNWSEIATVGTTVNYRNFAPGFKKELDDAFNKGLITGRVKDDLKLTITREEFAEIAVIYYKMVTGIDPIPAPLTTFTDTTNIEIFKAYAVGITDGIGNNKFAPNNYLNREQMAKMIVSTLKACYTTLNTTVTDVPDFADQANIATWATEQTKFMYKYSITLGVGNGNFGPKVECPREQAIVFLMRALNNKDQYLN